VDEAPPALLRPATDEDEPFLYLVYASTREAELAPLGWDEAAKHAFLQLQFSTQDRTYRSAHPGGAFDLIIIGGEPAGRLYVDRRTDSIHVIDIALLPEHRGRGIGTGLLRALLEEGRGTGRRVTINALRTGAALALYRRLGFEVVRERGAHVELEWTPS
jgi:ribosomal protein S18 acetylase RimI-like enzyme